VRWQGLVPALCWSSPHDPLEALNSSITAPPVLTGIDPSVKEGRKTRTLRKMLGVKALIPFA